MQRAARRPIRRIACEQSDPASTWVARRWRCLRWRPRPWPRSERRGATVRSDRAYARVRLGRPGNPRAPACSHTSREPQARAVPATGSFKARGALAVMLGLSPEQLARGVTAVSAGNHAIATAWAARELGAHAKVVMLASANPPGSKGARLWGRARHGAGRRGSFRHRRADRPGGGSGLRPSLRRAAHGARHGDDRTGMARAGPGTGSGGRSRRRRRSARGDGLRGQADAARLPRLRRRAVRGRQHVAQHGRRQSPATGACRDHRRQPGRSLRAALQLRAVPPVRRTRWCASRMLPWWTPCAWCTTR